MKEITSETFLTAGYFQHCPGWACRLQLNYLFRQECGHKTFQFYFKFVKPGSIFIVFRYGLTHYLMSAFVQKILKKRGKENYQKFKNQLQSFQKVRHVYGVSGKICILILIQSRWISTLFCCLGIDGLESNLHCKVENSRRKSPKKRKIKGLFFILKYKLQ